MTDCKLVFSKEWMSFRGSDRSVFYIYGIMALFYTVVFSLPNPEHDAGTPILWWVLFSIVVSGTFSSLLFIAERTSGQLEIFLTMGISRDAVVLGKTAFALVMSAVMAVAPLIVSMVFIAVAGEDSPRGGMWGPVLYLGASFMNAANLAWLSFRMSNPRISHFVNLLVLTVSVSIYLGTGLPQYLLLVFFLVAGSFSLNRALRAIHSERVVQPVSL